MSDKKHLPLSIPQISANEWRYIKSCLDTGWVSSSGSLVGEFERKVASYIGVKHAVSCANGTCALHISVLLAGVGRGDEVIVPTVTFIAPVNTVRYVGAEPVFIDCDDYLNIDPVKIREFIDKKCSFKNGKLINKSSRRMIKAILAVHIFGHPVNIAPIMAIAKKYKLKVIEDATESLGSHYLEGPYKGKKSGSIGYLGCLSFNGNKIITAGGGGMIVTDDAKAAARARYLLNQAKDDDFRYIHNEIGYNYRLPNINAALGIAQLERLEEFIGIKRANFEIYNKAIAAIGGLEMLEEPDYAFSNYWLYCLLVDKDKYGYSNFDLIKILAKEGIETRPLWHLNHKQQPYKKNESYEIKKAGSFYNKVLNLPCSTSISESQIKRVIKTIAINKKR